MKKFLSILLITVMALSMLPYSAMADGTVIEVVAGPGYQADVNHTGMVVTPEINIVSDETPAGYIYQWYAQNNWADEYILPMEKGRFDKRLSAY